MDLRTGELRKSGALLHLRPQPFKVLALLASRPGELVTQEEIQREIWGEDTFVDYDQGLRVAIKKIRGALGDESRSPRYIETLSRRGYRFIAPVESVAATSSPATADASPSSAETQTPGAAAPVPAKRRLRNRWLLAGGAAMAIALALVGLNAGGLRVRLLNAVEARGPAPAPKIRSIAVLPLENVSGGPTEDFFSEGLTDQLTTDLAEMGSLRVISRTSAMAYAGKKKPLPQIARELNVDAVVEGTAMRVGDRVRITAHLVDARRDKYLWAGTFEGQATDVLQLEDNVARQIATSIKAKISPMAHAGRPNPERSVNPAAQDAYWRGRYLFDRRRRERAQIAVADFRKAIAVDPQYARAYAGLAQALLSESYLQAARPNDVIQDARDATHRALQLDPNLSEAYCALGMIQGTYDHDWTAAEGSLRRSLTLNPNNSLAEIFLSVVLSSEGQTGEAVAHARRALTLDPLSFFANRHLGSILYLARRYDEALAQFRLTSALQDNPGVIDNWISWVHEARHEYASAVDYDLKALTASGAMPAQLERYRTAYRRGGWRGYWQAKLSDWPRYSRDTAGSSCVEYNVGLAKMRTGSKAAALAELSRAVKQHCVWTTWLKVDPRLDPLRSDPRFQVLLRHMNLSPTDVVAVSSH